MRILLLNQFFWPDSAATSQLLTDLAREFVRQGHEVYAVSADGGYAPAADDVAPPVHMYRVKSLPFVRGKIGRVLSYASFLMGATWHTLTLPKPDLVITLTTPPLISLLGNLARIFRHARLFIWEMDMYPDVAVDIGYITAGGWLDRLTGALADWSRRHADGIIALGECMKQRLVRRGVPAEKVFVASNWADSAAIAVLPKRGDKHQLTLLYSGNLGLAHDIETIQGAMVNLRDDARFHFLFVGGGARSQRLKTFAEAEAIGSIEFRPYAKRESLSESLAAGDIGLVTQRDVCCGSIVPSKVYGLLAAGRPVLFVGPAEATPAHIVRSFRCGWHINCGDVAALTDLLRLLAEHPEKVQAAGLNARQALLDHFDLHSGVERIATIVGARSPAPITPTSDALPATHASGRLRARFE